MSIAFQISGMRVGPFNEGKTLAFFSVEFGTEDSSGFTPLFVVNDFTLKPKNDGGYWVDGPNRFRRDKSGEFVKDGKGFAVKDYQWDVVFEGPDDNRKLSKASINYKFQITEKAVELYKSLSGKEGGSTKPAAKKAAPVAAGRKVSDPAKGSPIEDSDEEFPF